MRWVVVHPGPEFAVVDVYHGWTEALRELGQHVAGYNLGDRLKYYDSAHIKRGNRWRPATPDGSKVVELALNGLAAMLWKFRPQVLFLISGFFYDPAMLHHARSMGIRVVILHTESPYEDDRQIPAAAYADLNLVNDPVSVARFEQVAPAVYCPHAYRPAVHHPGPAEERYVCDLGFAGTGFRSRAWFFETMYPHIKDLDVILAGNWLGTGGAGGGLPDGSPIARWTDPGTVGMDNTDVAALYRSMRAGINLYRREANRSDLLVGHGCGPREIEMAACGAFFLRDPRPESDELFPMLPTFTGPDDAAGKLRWWLTHPDRRRDAALKAREAVAGRTFTAHAAHLLRLLGIKE